MNQTANELKRRHEDRQGSWAFIVGILGFCVLVSAHLTVPGMIAVVAVTALICWLVAAKF